MRECVLRTYSYAGGRLADWLDPLRVRACVRTLQLSFYYSKTF